MSVTPKNPTVSVCIPTCNRARMLEEAISSVLAQTFHDFELIICDNASEDQTESVVNSIKDQRIKYFRNQSNLGARGNWNRCLRESRGEFIALFPDDDVMMPDNLLEKVQVLKTHPGVGLIHSKYAVMNHDRAIVTASTNKECAGERTHDTIERGRDVLTTLLRHNIIHESTVIFRRDCYEQLGGFTDQLTLAFDWEYWMRIASSNDVAFIAKPLVKWRLHPGSLTIELNRRIAQQGEMAIARLRSDLAGFRWVGQTYLTKINPACAGATRRCLWRQMGARVEGYAVALLEGGTPKRQVRSLLLEMCRTYPEILIEVGVWKSWLKTLIGHQAVAAMKRLSPL